jgi:streptogramin lyase
MKHATSSTYNHVRTIGRTIIAAAAVAYVAFAAPFAAALTITEFPVPPDGGRPEFIVPGPDGNLWFTCLDEHIGTITTGGVITLFPVPAMPPGHPLSAPADIAVGADGNLWFTEFDGDEIAKITTSGVITEYSIATPNAAPYGITAGPDGNLWFVEGYGNKVGKITTGGAITDYPIPTASAFPRQITTGPDGDLWFTESGAIGKVTVGGVITEYPIPVANASPTGITSGPDGNLWFTDGENVRIGKITTAGVVTEYATPAAPGGLSDGILTGPDGNLWYTAGNYIGTVTTSGDFTFYTIPNGGGGPLGMTLGPDGNFWYADYSDSVIGKVARGTDTATGTMVPVPASTTFFNQHTNIDATIAVDVTFANVNSSGITIVTPLSVPPVALAPAVTSDIGQCSKTKTLGCQSDSNCPTGQVCIGYHAITFDVSTTASVTPPIKVCSHYADSETNPPGGNGIVDGTGKPGLPEKSLRLFHDEGGTFVDVTLAGYPDTLNNVVCGQVNSLSAFGMYVPTDMPGGSNKATDCVTEWSLCDTAGIGGSGNGGGVGTLPTNSSSTVVPKPTMTCSVSDPTCGGQTPNACTFCVRVCPNVQDARIFCTPTDVAQYSLTKLVAGSSSIDGTNATNILTALQNLAGGATNANQVSYAPALSSGLQCTDPITLVVPLPNGKKKVTKAIGLKARTSTGAVDANKLSLLCTQ